MGTVRLVRMVERGDGQKPLVLEKHRGGRATLAERINHELGAKPTDAAELAAWQSDVADMIPEAQEAAREPIGKSLSSTVKETAQALSHRLGIESSKLEGVLGGGVKRVPHDEREDVLQLLAINLLEAKPATAPLAWAVVRADVADWWRRYAIRQHDSLDVGRDDAEYDAGNPSDALVDASCAVVEWERMVDGKLDGHRLWQSLPTPIKAVVGKRLMGKRLSGAERISLFRWLKKDGVRAMLGAV